MVCGSFLLETGNSKLAPVPPRLLQVPTIKWHRMRSVRVCLFVLGLCAAIHAQAPVAKSEVSANHPSPTVSFELTFPGATPSHYAIAVESTGRASYRSDDAATPSDQGSSTADPYALEFTVSQATCTRIFELARQADYFKKNFNYSKGRIANMGTKTLTYTEGPANASGGTHYQTVYNYSENSAIQQLTAMFQDISNTVELGQRLKFHYRFDKLGLDADLKSAEDMARSGDLLELQVIAPVLRDLAEDTSVLHIARERAQRLLKQAGQ